MTALAIREPFQEFVLAYSKVRRDVFEDGIQCSNLESGMAGYCDVMRLPSSPRESDVAAGLSRHVIAETLQQPGKFLPAQVSGKLQTASTSSRTTWRRTMLGISS